MLPGTNNRLTVALPELKSAFAVFRKRGIRLGPVLVAFEGGFLSIESGEATAVMRAEGEWYGRATFSPNILVALANVPPDCNPVPISYADGRLFIAGFSMACQWVSAIKANVSLLTEPSLMDFLALERTIPRGELCGTALGKNIRSARSAAERKITAAAKHLALLEITEDEIRNLIEERIQRRLVEPHQP